MWWTPLRLNYITSSTELSFVAGTTPIFLILDSESTKLLWTLNALTLRIAIASELYLILMWTLFLFTYSDNTDLFYFHSYTIWTLYVFHMDFFLVFICIFFLSWTIFFLHIMWTAYCFACELLFMYPKTWVWFSIVSFYISFQSRK